MRDRERGAKMARLLREAMEVKPPEDLPPEERKAFWDEVVRQLRIEHGLDENVLEFDPDEKAT